MPEKTRPWGNHFKDIVLIYLTDFTIWAAIYWVAKPNFLIDLRFIIEVIGPFSYLGKTQDLAGNSKYICIWGLLILKIRFLLLCTVSRGLLYIIITYLPGSWDWPTWLNKPLIGPTLVVQSVTVVTATVLVVHAAVLRCQNPTKTESKAQAWWLVQRSLEPSTKTCTIRNWLRHFSSLWTGPTLVVQSVTLVTATVLVVHAAVLRCQNPTLDPFGSLWIPLDPFGSLWISLDGLNFSCPIGYSSHCYYTSGACCCAALPKPN